MENMLSFIEQHPVIPVFYHDNPEICKAALKASYEGGVRIFEFVNRGNNAVHNFELLQKYKEQHFPDLKLGIGTIKSKEQAEIFCQLNTDFLVSPVFDPSIAEIAKMNHTFWIPGCMTPTEINQAEIAGCKLIKLFPGDLLGIKFVKAIKPLFPGLKFMPTGGVKLNKENIQSWFEAGVASVGLGSSLFPSDFDPEEVTAQLKKVFSYIEEL
ncbi:ketohydroxyglutarate aldolase [Elizabethkingia meningoseptica]|uniref:bifunctional 4-hydroxy-2-oxoglutarate aldolase/2-dehydro-3-deoxy-phosphogluconate aldolase n=1 Tax=Elizabethkingia meningoseptica TaxID=238 RepID=UPI00099A4825|nr:bifunctional 4-hydroxy-2-oxoglutarate aldolase/2-dehydro-3-deoxy-phosphogluconate aldolase [Elizabethkingia meningoseptica]MEC4712637.1 bifunctional 4-hydroxy-2-oxoglutarate aldolase/2-dehydro-3-deoxy-phosphogluconate aldolase [Elizabethkingia meningoseptica]OPC23230.1 ketohydroxyglutarate aldolase [Elizabethkingia meningoseptica]